SGIGLNDLLGRGPMSTQPVLCISRSNANYKVEPGLGEPVTNAIIRTRLQHAIFLGVRWRVGMAGRRLSPTVAEVLLAKGGMDLVQGNVNPRAALRVRALPVF